MNVDWFHKFESVIKSMDEAGKEYASAKEISYYSQEMKHSVLASIQLGLGPMPISKGELEARASEDYKRHLKETAEAIKKELMAKSKYEKLKNQFEAYRSLISLEKKTQSDIGE